MQVPYSADIWLAGYARNRFPRFLRPANPKRVAITDHYEPFWKNRDEGLARQRVAHRPELLEPLAEMVRSGIGDVGIHIRHDGEGEDNFLNRVSGFKEALCRVSRWLDLAPRVGPDSFVRLFGHGAQEMFQAVHATGSGSLS